MQNFQENKNNYFRQHCFQSAFPVLFLDSDQFL